MCVLIAKATLRTDIIQKGHFFEYYVAKEMLNV